MENWEEALQQKLKEAALNGGDDDDDEEEEVKKEGSSSQPVVEAVAAAPKKEVFSLGDDEGEEEEEVVEVKPKVSKPLVKDSRDHLNIVFIGHVDAGKSTIAGQILLLTGMVDQRTIEKFDKLAKELKRESWYIAFIMDTNEEERQKGKTVEVGRAFFSTEKRRFTILDAPGHKNYVPNMIGGAAQADVGILVISARKGEFETGFERGGQTREHAMLAKTLGVNSLVVLINKMDEKTANWSKERYDDIQEKLNPFLKSLGFNIQKNVTYIPVSGLSGINLKVPIDPAICPWYKGPPLITILEQMPLPKRPPDGALRIPILDKYKESGKVIIQGKVEAGCVKLGQKVIIMPNKEVGEVTFLGTDVDEREECGPGENVRITAQGVRPDTISTGFVICDEAHALKPVSKFEAQIFIVGLLQHKPIFSAGYECVLHIHTATEEVTILKIVSGVDPKTGKPNNQKPQFVQEGGTVIAHLQTSQPVCIETYKDFPQLGRFTLRDEGKTIAIGKILRLAKNNA